MVGRAVFDLMRGEAKVIGTTRQPERLFEFVNLGIEPIVMPWPHAEIIEPLAQGAEVVASFPPDGTTDAILASACRGAKSIVYMSSTGVYGARRGVVDDSTAVDGAAEPAASRLAAEEAWKTVGATVLRAPAIYGPNSGLHVRLREGTFSIPGDGSGVVSRIHVDDLARLIIAVFDRGLKGETFVVGDLNPATHGEVVAWLCEQLNIPMPPYTSLDQVSSHLRASRQVDASRALEALGVELKYPTYREGFKAILSH
jgi:nucleoside-diphosphate-sugar epimerase